MADRLTAEEEAELRNQCIGDVRIWATLDAVRADLEYANKQVESWEMLAQKTRARAEQAEAERERYREALETASQLFYAGELTSACSVIRAALGAGEE